jgi:hypothetical protein
VRCASPIAVAQITDMRPGAWVVELPGADHLRWEGPQDDVLDAIERVLSDLEGTARLM